MNSQEGRKDSEKGFGEASRGAGALGKENGDTRRGSRYPGGHWRLSIPPGQRL